MLYLSPILVQKPNCAYSKKGVQVLTLPMYQREKLDNCLAELPLPTTALSKT